MASLTGTKIKDTYVGLLKTTDNGALGASAKLITDGLGNSSGVYLGTSGNVGMGTPSPADTLEVAKNSNGHGISITQENTGSGYYSKLDFLGNNGAGGTNTVASLRAYQGANGTNGDLRLFTNSAERMRIDSSGNVKIGDYLTDVTSKLTVSGNGSSNLATFMYDGNAGTYLDIDCEAANGVVELRADARTGGYPPMVFTTATTERMRITSGGYLKASNDGSYVGATSAFHELISNANGEACVRIINSGNSTPYGIDLALSGASPNNTSQYALKYADSTTARLYIWSNGNVQNYNNSYGAISDSKLKENIVDASPKLDDLMQVKIRNYNLIGDDKKQLGVVAQELEQVFPSMIDESPDFEEREVELRDENGEIVYETEQVLVSEEVAEVTEEVLHEAIAEELDADGNVIVEAQEAWTETIIVTPFQEAVYETVTTDRPVMTTERVDLGTTTKSVKYSVFVPILVKAMQEQQEIIQSQGDLINKLEARIAALEAR